MGFAKSVSAGNQRHGFFVIHRHAGERFPNVPGGSDGIRLAVRPFRIHIDQTHLNGTERVLQLSVAGVAFISEPLTFRSPVNIHFWFPDILTPSRETERRESHRFQRTVTGEDHQVGPRKFPAVLLLDRPEQPTRLVEVSIVGPTVERRKAECAGTSAATSVGDAVSACAVPRHPNEEWPIMTVVGRPPVLRRCHQLKDVLLQDFKVDAVELLSVVEFLIHRIGQGRVLVEHLQVQLIRPPISIRQSPSRCVPAGRAHHRALAFRIHILSDRVLNVFQAVSLYSDHDCLERVPASVLRKVQLNRLIEPVRVGDTGDRFGVFDFHAMLTAGQADVGVTVVTCCPES